MVFVLTGATLAYTGCTDYSKDLEDINNRLDKLETGSLKSVESQIESLKSTVAALESAKTAAENAIKDLQNNSASSKDVEALQKEIASLKAELAKAATSAEVKALSDKLAAAEALLKDFVTTKQLNDKVAELTTLINDAKALIPTGDIAQLKEDMASVKTFVEQTTEWTLNANATLGELDATLKLLAEEVASLKTISEELTTITTNLSGSLDAVKKDIVAINNELKGFEEKYSQINEALTNITTSLATVKLDITGIQTDVKSIKEALATIQNAGYLNTDEVAAAIKAAIESALATADPEKGIESGVITSDIAKAVADATKKLQEQIDALKNIVKDVANQIQSIVYVPEYADGKMKAYQFSLGDSFSSPVMVKATYEVTPHELAASITEDVVRASTVVVKAAPAEIFEVNILSKDPQTGRVEVCINIPEDTDAYDALMTPAATSTDVIALALNIADYKLANLPGSDDLIDSGSKKISSYVTVGKAEKVELNKQLKITKNGSPVTSPASPSFNVYYDEANSEKALFAGYDIAMEVFGELMSIEEAEEFFGTNLKLNFKETIVYKKGNTAMTAATTPIKLDGTGLDKTAKIQPITTTPKVEGKDMVGYKTIVTFDTFKLNGVNVTPALSLTATYNITATYSTIVYPDQSITWNYTYPNATVTSYYTAINEEVIGKGTTTTVNAALSRYVLTNGNWVEDQSLTNGEVATPNASTQTGEYQVTGKIKFENLLFTPGKQVKYVAKYEITDSQNAQKKYAVECTVYLDGMPADKTIDLGTVQVVRNYTAASTPVSLKPITNTFATDMDYYKQFDGNVNKFIATYLRTYPGTNAQNIVVKENGAAAANTNYDFIFGPVYDNNGNVIGENSTLYIPKASATAKNEIEVSMPVVAFGVTYTYKVKVILSNPATYSLKTNSTRVDPETLVALVGGTRVFGKATPQTTITGLPANVTVPVRSQYALNEVVLSDYVYVDNYNPSETMQVKFERITYDRNNQEVLTELTASPVAVGANGILDKTAKLTWDPTQVEYKLRATLQLTNNTNVNLGNVEFTLRPKTIIKSFAPTTATVDVVSGEGKTINLFNYLSVKDYEDNEIVYKTAAAKADMWDGTIKSGAKTYVVPGYYDVYGQNVTFDPDPTKVVVKHNGTQINNSLVNYSYNPTNGTITLSGNNADLIGKITFEVKATLTYNYGAQEETTVVVDFKQK